MRGLSRIRYRYFAPYQSPEQRKFRAVLLVLLLLLGLTVWLNVRLRPFISRLAEANAVNAAVHMIDSSVNQTITEKGITYQKMVTLEKDSSGRVTSLQSNMANINLFQTELTDSVIDALSGMDSRKLSVPLGNVIGGALFSGLGPRIPVHVLSVGEVSTSFENLFSEAGINQTRHQIMLKIRVTFSLLIPGYTEQASAESQFCIAESVIVGQVPESYTLFAPAVKS